MGVPRAEHTPPSFDQKRIGDQNQNRCGSYPLPAELEVGDPRLDFIPLSGKRTGREKKYQSGEAPLREPE